MKSTTYNNNNNTIHIRPQYLTILYPAIFIIIHYESNRIESNLYRLNWGVAIRLEVFNCFEQEKKQRVQSIMEIVPFPLNGDNLRLKSLQ